MGTDEQQAREDLRETAYHEAGHAVAAYILGRGFHHVTIVPDEDDGSLGHVLKEVFPEEFQPDSSLDGAGVAALEVDCLLSLAGGIAGERAVGAYNASGCSRDNEQLIHLASFVHEPGAGLDEYLERLNSRAQTLMSRAWPAVEAVAQSLLLRCTLTAEEVGRVVEVSLPPDRAGASIMLEGRIAALEAELQALRSQVNIDRTGLIVPLALFTRSGRIVGWLGRDGRITEEMPPPSPEDDTPMGLLINDGE